MAEELRESEMEVIEAGPVRPVRRFARAWARSSLGPRGSGRWRLPPPPAPRPGSQRSRSPGRREPNRRPPRRGLFRRREKVVASRSFLVDVHILGASRACSAGHGDRGAGPAPLAIPIAKEQRGDGVIRVRGNVIERLLHVGQSPVRVRSCAPGRDTSTCGRSRSIRRGSSIRSPSPARRHPRRGPRRARPSLGSRSSGCGSRSRSRTT